VKNPSAILPIGLLLAACATPLEAVRLALPDTPLALGYQADQPGRGTIREFLPPNENIESWRHLLTIQFFEGERRSPETMVDALHQLALAHGGTLQWQVLERDADSVTYEWSLVDCKKPGAEYQDQAEVARMLRGNDGLHRVAYTERARQMDSAARDKFLKAIAEAIVMKDGKRIELVKAPI
jgi:hypothetical protein